MRISPWVIVLVLLSLVPAAAQTPQLSVVDGHLRSAFSIGQADVRVRESLSQAEKALEAVHGSRQPRAGAPTDLDVTVRARLIDIMRTVASHEAKGETLESVRGQVRALDLLRSLWEAAKARQAEETPQLNALVTALYDRLVATGSRDKNSAVTFGVPAGDELIYRIFAAGRDGQMSPFELSGNRGQRQAVWRETPFPTVKNAVLQRVRQAFALSKAGGPVFPEASYPFVLVLGGTLAAVDYATEKRLRTRLEELVPQGVLPLMITAGDRAFPFTTLPALAVADNAEGVLGGASAVLIHRASGAQVQRFDPAASAAKIDALLRSVAGTVTEIGTDLGYPAQRSRLDAPSLDRAVAAPKSAAKPEAEAPLLLVVAASAAVVGEDASLALPDGILLRLVATFPQDNWGQYRLDGKQIVWLKRNSVVTYVPPELEEAPKTKARPDPKPDKSRAKPK